MKSAQFRQGHLRSRPIRLCSTQVWRARCKVTGEIVAIKVMDLENVNCSLVCRGPPLLRVVASELGSKDAELA